jgi:hypothetical protein
MWRTSVERDRRHVWHEQRTAAGRCHLCGEKVGEINLKTGIEFWNCRACRLRLSVSRSGKADPPAPREALVLPGEAAPPNLRKEEK